MQLCYSALAIWVLCHGRVLTSMNDIMPQFIRKSCDRKEWKAQSLVVLRINVETSDFDHPQHICAIKAVYNCRFNSWLCSGQLKTDLNTGPQSTIWHWHMPCCIFRLALMHITGMKHVTCAYAARMLGLWFICMDCCVNRQGHLMLRALLYLFMLVDE